MILLKNLEVYIEKIIIRKRPREDEPLRKFLKNEIKLNNNA